MPTINVQVAASSDDAYQNGTAVSIGTTVLVVDSATDYAGMRFTNVTVPQGATIDSATLSVYVNNATYDTPNGLVFKGEDTDNSAAFAATTNNISSRTLTTASATWSGSNIQIGDKTITVTSIIQEIVDRAGWVSGSALAIIGQGVSGTDVRWRSYDGSTTECARLSIEYSLPGPAGHALWLNDGDLPMFLKEDTINWIVLGPFIDDTDFKTVETGLSLTVQIAKTSPDPLETVPAFAARNSATAISHLADGYYKVELNATDCDTPGMLEVKATATGALPVRKSFMVLPAAVYNGMVLGIDYMPVSVADVDIAEVPGLVAMIDDYTNGEFDVRLQALDGNATAMDNLVDAFTSTGYTFQNTTIGADMTAISTSSAAADLLEAAMLTLVTGTAVTGTLTTTTLTTNLTEATDDHYNGRLLTFRGGALDGQQRTISDYNGTTKLITLASALTEAPTNAQAFVIS